MSRYAGRYEVTQDGQINLVFDDGDAVSREPLNRAGSLSVAFCVLLRQAFPHPPDTVCFDDFLLHVIPLLEKAFNASAPTNGPKKDDGK